MQKNWFSNSDADTEVNGLLYNNAPPVNARECFTHFFEIFTFFYKFLTTTYMTLRITQSSQPYTHHQREEHRDSFNSDYYEPPDDIQPHRV